VPFGRTYPAVMRVIHSPLHRLHEPPFEVFSGHPGPAASGNGASR